MSTWAIGDVQGCYSSLRALLARVDFDPSEDTLWLAGDLVNRGPRSLDVLRFVRDLEERAVCVLGNHDLNLLAAGAGLREPRRRDTIAQVLDAADSAELLDWLRGREVLHVADGFAMIHAGLLREWSVADAAALGSRAAERLRGDGWRDFLATIYVDGRPRTGLGDEVSDALAHMTYVRCIDEAGRPVHGFTGAPEEAPPGARPWWEGRDDAEILVFGHWASLGFRRGAGWIALDSGCVWGGALTAVRLEDGEAVQVPAED